MTASVPRAARRFLVLVLVVMWLLVCLAGRGLVWLARAVGCAAGFVAEPVDELLTAWLGIAPVLPRMRRWGQQVMTEWRAYRAGAIEGEVMDGVWR